MDDTNAIIIDNGSGVCKAGFAGDDSPNICFPNVVGKPKHPVTMISSEDEPVADSFIGEQAQENRGLLSMVYPITHGVVQDWNLMEQIWAYLFEKQLKVDPMDHSVLLTEAPLNPKKNREKMLEVMFDSFGIPATYVAMGAVLSLYAAGRTTGVVLDVGDGITHTVPIFEGYTKTFAIGRLQLAGRDLTEYLTRLLHERGYLFESTAEQEIVRDMKEKLCYIPLDYENEMTQFEANPGQFEEEFELPDGETVTLGSERFRCPELLFQPEMVGREQGGLPHLVNKTIMKCGMDTRRVHYGNIVVSGGTTLLNGFADRVEQDITKLAPQSAEVKVISPDERKDSVWMGGSILASLSSFQDMWISKLEYQERGPSIVHKKCLYAA